MTNNNKGIETVQFDNGYGTTYVFEVVESVPQGFKIWNIGYHMVDGYIPLCEPIEKGSYTINPNTLKAIKYDKAQELLNCVGAGYCGTLKECESYLKRKKQSSYHSNKCLKALPLLKELKWN